MTVLMRENRSFDRYFFRPAASSPVSMSEVGRDSLFSIAATAARRSAICRC
jgi:hypothetical protein